MIWRNECQRMPEGNERRHAKHGYERFGTRQVQVRARLKSIRLPRSGARFAGRGMHPPLLDTGNENGEHGGGRLGPGAAVPQNTNSPCPPTGRQLARNPVVRSALNNAFHDSRYGTGNAHEEGGWIYMVTTTGNISVIRAQAGSSAGISLRNPPNVSGSIIVGDFHTHPHPTGSPMPGGGVWDWRPDGVDIAHELLRGVPGVVRSDHGIIPYGPNRRGSDPRHAGRPGIDGGFPGSGADTRRNCR